MTFSLLLYQLCFVVPFCNILQRESEYCRILCPRIRQRLLMVEWKGPLLIELETRHFDAMGPYFKHAPASIPLVVDKLFKLLTSLPVTREYGDTEKDTMRARLQVCTSFLRLARAGDVAMLPYMQSIAETMTKFHGRGLMVRSELNLLGESLLKAAASPFSLEALLLRCMHALWSPYLCKCKEL